MNYSREMVRPRSGPAEQLRLAIVARAQAEVAEVLAIADLAAAHSWSAEDRFEIGEQLVRLGSDGTALVGEFLPLEVAALKRVSVGSASWLIRDVLNLQARYRHLWAAVLAGSIPVWEARKLVVAIETAGLDQHEAALVDAVLRARYGHFGVGRLWQAALGQIAKVNPDKFAALTAQARDNRGVHFRRLAEPTLAGIDAVLDTHDAELLDRTLNAVAAQLAADGDDRELNIRRAKALGILANPDDAAAVLAGTEPARQPKLNIYLHLAPADLTSNPDPSGPNQPNAALPSTCAGHASVPATIKGASDNPSVPDGTTRPIRLGRVGRLEGTGPVLIDQLADLFGRHKIHITPIVHTPGEIAVDSYEIPERIRRAVWTRDHYEAFPYSSRLARNLDLDHTDPYRAQPDGTPTTPGQTRPSNLGPLSRKTHRAKTFGGWKLTQPAPGIFWWTSPQGHRYRVGPHGTQHLNNLPGRLVSQLWKQDRTVGNRYKKLTQTTAEDTGNQPSIKPKPPGSATPPNPDPQPPDRAHPDPQPPDRAHPGPPPPGTRRPPAGQLDPTAPVPRQAPPPPF